MNTFNPDALKTQLETLQNRVTTRQQALNTYLKNPSQTALPANVFDPDAQRAWDAVGGMQAYKEVPGSIGGGAWRVERQGAVCRRSAKSLV